jgi:hypothetical protein
MDREFGKHFTGMKREVFDNEIALLWLRKIAGVS